MSGPRAPVEWAKVALMAAETSHELAHGVLSRKADLDRAARIALIRASDYMAFVAEAIADGDLTPEEGAELRLGVPAFDVDHEQLISLYEPRQQIKALLIGGVLSPFANMGPPPKWPAEAQVERLAAALKGLLAQVEDTGHPHDALRAEIDEARAALREAGES